MSQTHDIDVGAKYEIYKITFELASEGKAILLIAFELPEPLALCDRLYVMAKGRIVTEMLGPQFDQERIMKFAAMGGGAPELRPPRPREARDERDDERRSIFIILVAVIVISSL